MAARAAIRSIRERSHELPPLEVTGLQTLERCFADSPEELLRHFRRAVKRPPTRQTFASLLAEARVALEMPDAYAQLLAKRGWYEEAGEILERLVAKISDPRMRAELEAFRARLKEVQRAPGR